MWFHAIYETLFAFWLFLSSTIVKGVVTFSRLFKISAPVMELPVTTSNIVVPRVMNDKQFLRRFVLKPILFVYNALDNAIYQVCDAISWHAPAYTTPITNALKFVRSSVCRWLETKLLRLASIVHQDLDVEQAGGTLPVSSPNAVVSDDASEWTNFHTHQAPEHTGEWTYYIGGSEGRAVMTITQSAWNSYQLYRIASGMDPVSSPSKITVSDFEVYLADMAKISLVMESTPSSTEYTPSPSDANISPLSSSPASSSSSPLDTPAQSPNHLTLDVVEFDPKVVTSEDMGIVEGTVGANEILDHNITPSVVVEDSEGPKRPPTSRTPTTTRNPEFNFPSVNSFGDIEALVEESFGTPVPDADEILRTLAQHARPSPCLTSNSSFYSKASASTDQCITFDSLPKDHTSRDSTGDVSSQATFSEDALSVCADSLAHPGPDDTSGKAPSVVTLDLEDSMSGPTSVLSISPFTGSGASCNGNIPVPTLSRANCSIEHSISHTVKKDGNSGAFARVEMIYLRPEASSLLLSSVSTPSCGLPSDPSKSTLDSVGSVVSSDVTVSLTLPSDAAICTNKISGRPKTNRFARVTSGLALDLKSFASGITSFQKRNRDSQDSTRVVKTLDTPEFQPLPEPEVNESSRPVSWVTFRVPSSVSSVSHGSSASIHTPTDSCSSFFIGHDHDSLCTESYQQSPHYDFQGTNTKFDLSNASKSNGVSRNFSEPSSRLVSTRGTHPRHRFSPASSTSSPPTPPRTPLPDLPTKAMIFPTKEHEFSPDVEGSHQPYNFKTSSQKKSKRVSGLRPLLLPSLLATRIKTPSPIVRESQWGVPF